MINPSLRARQLLRGSSHDPELQRQQAHMAFHDVDETLREQLAKKFHLSSSEMRTRPCAWVHGYGFEPVSYDAFETYVGNHLGSLHPWMDAAKINLFEKMPENVAYQSSLLSRLRVSEHLTGEVLPSMVAFVGLFDKEQENMGNSVLRKFDSRNYPDYFVAGNVGETFEHLLKWHDYGMRFALRPVHDLFPGSDAELEELLKGPYAGSEPVADSRTSDRLAYELRVEYHDYRAEEDCIMGTTHFNLHRKGIFVEGHKPVQEVPGIDWVTPSLLYLMYGAAGAGLRGKVSLPMHVDASYVHAKEQYADLVDLLWRERVRQRIFRLEAPLPEFSEDAYALRHDGILAIEARHALEETAHNLWEGKQWKGYDATKITALPPADQSWPKNDASLLVPFASLRST